MSVFVRHPFNEGETEDERRKERRKMKTARAAGLILLCNGIFDSSLVDESVGNV